VANAILDATTFRRELPEARALEGILSKAFWNHAEAGTIADEAGLGPEKLDLTGPPSTFWGRILDAAARAGVLARILERVEARQINQAIKQAIADVRSVNQAGGSLQPTRLLLDGGRPFLGRHKLREVAPELQNWNGSAAILVVRGDEDSGRTETHVFLADRNTDKLVVLGEELQLRSSMREIWKAAGAAGEPPAPGQGALTTESALLQDFWIDVKEALDTSDRRLWIMFDDLDKGPGRSEVRALAEVLAVRLKLIPFQRRIRLVLLGYPEPKLPDKVPAICVREDRTDELTEIQVKAFLDYCLAATGKQIAEDRDSLAKRVCDAARARATAATPYVEALNGELTSWYRGLTA
jgi:hypothetical protein